MLHICLLWKPILNSVSFLFSSGSTAFPKPIYLSNRYLLRMTRAFPLMNSSSEGAESFNENDSILTCVPL
jgi:hypothetical protein